MANTTLAAVLTQTGSPLEIKELKIPSLLPGQVLVKILYSGMCRSQLMEVKGGRGEDRWLPHLLGHEGSGIVESIGPDVSKVTPGDEVILTWIKGEGMEASGGIFLDGDRRINAGPVTTFSQYSVVAENRIVKKPAEIPFDTAILFGCALPTGAGMVLNELEISSHHTAAVIGLGGVGISALLALIAKGVEQLIAIDCSPKKLEAARSWGVSHCIDSGQENWQDALYKVAEDGVDFCIEAAGSVASIESGFEIIKKGGGQLLFASHPPEGEKICLSPHDLISGKQIAGSWGGGVIPDRDVPRLSALLSGSSIPLNSLLTQRYTLTDINQALDDLDAGRVFRPLIDMGHI